MVVCSLLFLWNLSGSIRFSRFFTLLRQGLVGTDLSGRGRFVERECLHRRVGNSSSCFLAVSSAQVLQPLHHSLRRPQGLGIFLCRQAVQICRQKSSFQRRICKRDQLAFGSRLPRVFSASICL